MRPTICLFVLLTAFGPGLRAQAPPLLGNAAELPFTLELEETTQDELPGFHSMAFGRWNGWWVIIAGRIGGLHGFFPFTAFPDNEANTSIWILDPENGESRQISVDDLTVPFKNPLKATNPQYTQYGDDLYLTGGFGKDATTGNFRTFPTLTVVHLPTLVTAMLNQQNPSAAFRQTNASELMVCGGEMERLGDDFYLVGGHDFSGTYAQNNPNFNQVYTNQIRKFRLEETPDQIIMTDYSAFSHPELHRRDFSMAPLVRPDGAPALGLYGGVFRPDADLPYYNPVYLAEDSIFTLDTNFEQAFSQYTCPALPMYDEAAQTMYTLFFGGISTYFYNENTQSVQYDPLAPFIKDISALRRQANGDTRQYLLPQRFDALLGANMVFVPADDAPQFSNEVIRLNALQGKTQVGFLFGGIHASIPNYTPSEASNRMFKVYITPGNSVATAAPVVAAPVLWPNPARIGTAIRLPYWPEGGTARLYDAAGQLQSTCMSALDVEQTASALGSGVYYLQVQSAAGALTYKLIKI
jgi:hypothetical protein